MARNSVEKFAVIDWTRAIAVALVVWVHAHQQIPGLHEQIIWLFNFGQLGVQLFFVASAFTLCHSMTSRGEAGVADFYWRRFFRIAPLYYTAIIFYFLWRYSFYTAFDGMEHPDHLIFDEYANYDLAGIVLNVFFLHGFSPFHQNFVVPGGWSIAAEFAFYAIFPLLYRYLVKLSSWRILSLVIILTICSAAGQYLLYDFVNSRTNLAVANDEFGFFYATIFNQLPVFLIGIYVFSMRRTDVPMSAVLGGCVLIVIGFLMQNDRTLDTSVDGAIFPVLVSLGFALILIRAINRFDRYRFGSFQSARYFIEEAGRRSFSIYILHFAVVDIARILCADLPMYMNVNLVPFLIFVVVFAATYWLAGYTEKYIEKPGVALGKRFISRSKLRGAQPVVESS